MKGGRRLSRDVGVVSGGEGLRATALVEGRGGGDRIVWGGGGSFVVVVSGERKHPSVPIPVAVLVAVLFVFVHPRGLLRGEHLYGGVDGRLLYAATWAHQV
jgi:hypothetical protein